MRAASAFRQSFSHVIIDGVIETTKVRRSYKSSTKEPLLQPEGIEDACWNVIQQERTAWSLENRPASQ
jgi:hypothetical protein